MESGVKIVRTWMLVLAGACLAGFAIQRFCVEPYRCVTSVNEVSSAMGGLEQLTDLRAKVARAETNLLALRSLSAQCRTDVNIPFLIGVNEGIAGRPEAAIAAYESALLLDHRPEIYNEIGNQLLIQGKVDQAIDAFLYAARFGAAADLTYSPSVAARVEDRLRGR
jgi:tetratricopeptide (TPR) repeat protein